MRYFLEISYLGTNYAGFQVQPNEPSIQGEIESALTSIFNQQIRIAGAGRTDSGVHCRQTFVHFDVERAVPENLAHRLNTMVPKDITVKRCIPVHDDAHARFDAVRRAYDYFIHFKKDPFLHGRSYHFTFAEPDIELMKDAAEVIPRFSDFNILSRDNPQVKSTVCRIYRSELETINNGSRLVFHIEANRFLYNMVRRIVGAFLAIGEGKMTITTLEECLAENKPLPINKTAPPEGLYLTKVQYPFIEEKTDH